MSLAPYEPARERYISSFEAASTAGTSVHTVEKDGTRLNGWTALGEHPYSRRPVVISGDYRKPGSSKDSSEREPTMAQVRRSRKSKGKSKQTRHNVSDTPSENHR